MAKFVCTLGFKEREFRYTQADREAFEEKFGGVGMWKIIREQVLALNANDEPTPGGTIKAQRALVWIGLRHSGPRVTEDAVGKWLDEEGQREGGNVFAIYSTAANAVLASGVLGMKYEMPADEEADPKEEAPSSQTEPSPQGS